MKRIPRRKFNLSVPYIMERRQLGETYQQIAAALGCHHVTVFHALKREILDHKKRLQTRPKRVDPRLAGILEARALGEPLEEIGVRLGITREYVRLIIKNADLDEAVRKSVTGRVKPKKPRPLRRLTTSIVNRWLAGIGWRYCSPGRHVQPVTEFSDKGKNCRKCERERMSRYHNIRPADTAGGAS